MKLLTLIATMACLAALPQARKCGPAYVHCVCTDSKRDGNDGATSKICEGFANQTVDGDQPVVGMIEANKWSSSAAECRVLPPPLPPGQPPPTGVRSRPFGFSFCNWRELCVGLLEGSTGARCRDQSPVGHKSADKVRVLYPRKDWVVPPRCSISTC